MKDLTGLTISPSFTDHHTEPGGNFSFEMKITVEREMLKSIKKLKTLHHQAADSYWSLLVKSFKLGEERSNTRSKLSSILKHLEQIDNREGEDVATRIKSTKHEIDSIITQLTDLRTFYQKLKEYKMGETFSVLENKHKINEYIWKKLTEKERLRINSL